MNKILEVFTKQYKEETKYQIFMEKNVDRIKLQSNNYDVEERIQRLKNKNLKSNFRVGYNIEEPKVMKKTLMK
jgi:hypothetical protein